MIVLAVAVIAATGFLVLRQEPKPPTDGDRVEALLRKFGDPDSDVRREGEEGLRKMGAAAVEPLRKASTSSDRVLADRAGRLYQELRKPELPGPPATPEPLLDELSAGDVEIEINCSGSPEKAQRWGNYMVTLANRGRSPALLAFPAEAVAWFELEDDQGRRTRVEAEPAYRRAAEGSVERVSAGSQGVYFLGSVPLWNALSRADVRSVRFVYDASHPAYRATAAKFGGGAPLPPAKLVSKTFVLADVR